MRSPSRHRSPASLRRRASAHRPDHALVFPGRRVRARARPIPHRPRRGCLVLRARHRPRLILPALTSRAWAFCDWAHGHASCAARVPQSSTCAMRTRVPVRALAAKARTPLVAATSQRPRPMRGRRQASTRYQRPTVALYASLSTQVRARLPDRLSIAGLADAPRSSHGRAQPGSRTS